MKAAVIGLGVVGRAQARMLVGDADLVTYDVTDPWSYPADQIAGCDFAILAVGTPAAEDGSADLTQVHEAFGRLPDALPVLIRSTVPPGTTAALQDQHDGPVCHAPEFMHERPGGAWQETTDVPYLILGGTPEACGFFRPLLAAVFPGRIHECSATEAEFVKYTANLHWAARVTFVNEMARICEASGADWENVRAAWLEDPRVSPDYTGYAGFPPGFGGRCWPKDLTALIAGSRGTGYDPEFLEAIEGANDRFTHPGDDGVACDHGGKVMPRFKTDKDEPHGYIPDYLHLAGEIGPAGTVCEVGVLYGDSLVMWQELFPEGQVIGVDRDPASVWPDGTCKIVAEQDDPQLNLKVAAVAPGGCDLIVDDASHIGHLSAATFAQLWPLVKPGGYYVVEDWADRWVSPHLPGWADVDPKYRGDELQDYVPELITALKDSARTVTYTYEGLVILQRSR